MMLFFRYEVILFKNWDRVLFRNFLSFLESSFQFFNRDWSEAFAVSDNCVDIVWTVHVNIL